MTTSSQIYANHLLQNVRSNIVQSIRAFRIADLQKTAAQLSQHFLHVNLAGAQTKEDVLEMIGEQFALPAHYGNNFDALYDCITDPLHKSGPQPGFIVVVENIPTNPNFARETREQLLDTFRDAADYWGDRKVAFRCFYSFSVARAIKAGQPKWRTPKRQPQETDETIEWVPEEKLPTDKIVDVTSLALRMSCPFNAHYWLSAASEDEKNKDNGNKAETAATTA